MDVSSGDLQIPLLVAQKMDEEFYGIFYLLHCVQREMRMMGDKEDDMWSRFGIRFKSIVLKENMCPLSSSYNNTEWEIL